jgi:hypothetical protein
MPVLYAGARLPFAEASRVRRGDECFNVPAMFARYFRNCARGVQFQKKKFLTEK